MSSAIGRACGVTDKRDFALTLCSSSAGGGSPLISISNNQARDRAGEELPPLRPFLEEKINSPVSKELMSHVHPPSRAPALPPAEVSGDGTGWPRLCEPRGTALAPLHLLGVQPSPCVKLPAPSDPCLGQPNTRRAHQPGQEKCGVCFFSRSAEKPAKFLKQAAGRSSVPRQKRLCPGSARSLLGSVWPSTAETRCGLLEGLRSDCREGLLNRGQYQWL